MAHRKHLKPTQFTRRQALMALLGSVAIPGCGGGSVAGLSSGGTGSFTNGVIIGLGSIIVNGIRYDDSAATVNGSRASGVQNQLKLGMVVSVQGSGVTPAKTAGALPTATANSISYESEWKGQITDVTANTLTMFGKTINLLGSTVFSPGEAALNTDPVFAEVHGFVNPVDGSLQASRVDVLSVAPSSYRISGAITALGLDSTFSLGSALINYAGTPIADRPQTLQVGMVVRVELKVVQGTNNDWIATRIRSVNALADIEYDDDDEAEVEGSITAFTSNSSFSVNGIPVDASHAAFELNDLAIGLGMRVKVEGSVVNGSIVASKVKLEDDDSVEAREFEFHGTISGLNADLQTFVVKGYTLNYVSSGPSATQFEPERAVLSNGLQVEVKARQDASGQLIASEIKVDD